MQGRKVYLIDTENVGSVWKDLLDFSDKKDSIILFYTDNSPRITYTELEFIRKFPDAFDMIECKKGKNGLDFQLVSYLGYLLKTAVKSNYIIVSNDNGFDSVVNFWQDRGMNVFRMSAGVLTRSIASDRNADSSLTQIPVIGVLPEPVPEIPAGTIAADNTVNDSSSIEHTVSDSDQNADGDVPMDTSDANTDDTLTHTSQLIVSFLSSEYQNDNTVVEAVSKIISSNSLHQLQKIYQSFLKCFGQEKGIAIYKMIKPHLKSIYNE